MADFLAHSARCGCPPQLYGEHIRNVTRGALHRARAMLRYYTPGKPDAVGRRGLLEIAGDAASFHDFGKLDDGFQETLRTNRYSSNHVRHEDAGVALLSQFGAMEAAGLVSAHHQGLVKYEYEMAQLRPSERPSRKLGERPFRIDHPLTSAATRRRLHLYKQRHQSLLDEYKRQEGDRLAKCSGFVRRLLLSCLVDADHFDTARHYGQDIHRPNPPARWLERIDALDSYVAQLRHANESRSAAAAATLRQEVRDELYAACKAADPYHRLYQCDAVVGSGKTTAVMAHLLRVCAERRLRRVFVVLPYTNIIRQSVQVYRDALTLPGEDPAEIVAEHHHQVEFKGLSLRHLTTLWRAPIVITTAVQFFETLGARDTASLRKLHALPGAAVFLDEAHAALPTELWPQCWNWLQEWTSEWGGHLVLASGSLPEFWRLDEFRTISEGRRLELGPRAPAADVRPLASRVGAKSNEAEGLRISFHTRQESLSGDDLIAWVEQSRGPRLVIVNTVQAAALLAKRMKERNRQLVLHLSTALAPIHRSPLVERVHEMLKHQDDWTLVATSMVEAGLDFSFGTGFRQRSSAASLIQTAGRVNRNADKEESCLVWDFDLNDDEFRDNPQLRNAKQALRELIVAGRIAAGSQPDLSRLCLEALQMEFKPARQQAALDPVLRERDMDYPQVAVLCRVIKDESATVLVDRSLAERVQRGYRVASADITQRSVRMYHSRVRDLGLEPVVADSRELYVLPEGWRYDPDFLGYMAGWFDFEQSRIAGGYFV